jgi:hypothetical protein
LAGEMMVSSKPWPFVLRIRRGRDRALSNSARGSGSLCRSFVVGVALAGIGARAIWCPDARFAAGGGGSGGASSTTSTEVTGSIAEQARGVPRSTRHNRCASPVSAGTSIDSQSQRMAMVRPRFLGMVVAPVLLRRPVAAAVGLGPGFGAHREISKGPICTFSFFGGLSACVLVQLYLLEFSRDFCVFCIEYV